MINNEYEIGKFYGRVQSFMKNETKAKLEHGYFTFYPDGSLITDLQLIIEHDCLMLNVCLPKEQSEEDNWEQFSIAKDQADEYLKGTSFEKFDNNDLGDSILIHYSLELQTTPWEMVKKSLDIVFQTHRGKMWKKLKLIQGKEE